MEIELKAVLNVSPGVKNFPGRFDINVRATVSGKAALGSLVAPQSPYIPALKGVGSVSSFLSVYVSLISTLFSLVTLKYKKFHMIFQKYFTKRY